MSKDEMALALWCRWWDENQGDPYHYDGDSEYFCGFCGSEIQKKHDPECLYLDVAALLGREAIKESSSY